MQYTRKLARRLFFWGGIALIVWPMYELYVRLDAMYGPLKMFVDMAVGERVPFSRAIGYVDWSIFETPAYLAACLLLGGFAIGLRKRRKGSLALMPFAVGLAAFGWLDTPLFPVRTFQMLKLLPFAAVFAGGCLQAAANAARGKRRRARDMRPARDMRRAA